MSPEIFTSDLKGEATGNRPRPSGSVPGCHPALALAAMSHSPSVLPTCFADPFKLRLLTRRPTLSPGDEVSTCVSQRDRNSVERGSLIRSLPVWLNLQTCLDRFVSWLVPGAAPAAPLQQDLNQQPET